MLARLYSKSFKLGFSGTWTENFQMHKLGWEKAEEPEIKLPTFVGWWRRQQSSRKTSTSASLTTLNPLTVWITTNWRILEDMGIPDHLTCLLRNLYAGQEATFKTGHVTTDWFKIGKGVGHIVYCHHAYLTSISAGSHHGRSHPWQRSCRRDLTGKGGSSLKGPPESALASTPKPNSVCLTILCLSPTLLTLTGGYPRPPFSEKVNLGL